MWMRIYYACKLGWHQQSKSHKELMKLKNPKVLSDEKDVKLMITCLRWR